MLSTYVCWASHMALSLRSLIRENGWDNSTCLTEFIVRFWLSRLVVDLQEMEPCSLPGASEEVSDALLVSSEPRCSILLYGRVGQALRCFYPALEVFNLRFPVATATLLKEGLAFWWNGGNLALGCVGAGTHGQGRKQKGKETLEGYHVLRNP